MMRGAVRRWLWSSHRWLGLACALFLLIQASSGMVMVVQDQLNLIEAVGLEAPTNDLRGLDRALQTLADHDPAYAPVLMTPPPKRSHSWQVYMSPTQTFGPRRLVSIDASSAELLTDQRYTQTRIGWLLQLHTELFAGVAGRWFLLALGVLMVILAVLGIVIMRNRWRTLTSTPWAGSMRWRALHRWSGIAGVTFVLLWVASGLLLQWSMVGSGGHEVESTHPATPVPLQVSLSHLLTTPEVQASQLFAISLPTLEQPQLVLTMVERTAMPWSKFTILLFDPADGRLLGRIAPADMPAWDRLMATARALHMGLFEMPMVQLIYLLLAALVIVMATTGPVTWLRARWRRS